MCEFCEEGKTIKADRKGEGINTARNNLSLIFGIDNEEDFAMARIDGNALFVDNSSGEYAELGAEIKYCPMCGRML